MKLKKVAITDYKGISDVEFSPGAVTIISGANGQGKTSILDAIRAFDERVHNPDRIRKGSDTAEVRIEMDNGHVYRMRVTRKATSWDLQDEKGRKITRSAEHIRSIINSISLDPVKFLAQKPVDQVETYLRISPLRVTAQDLKFLPVEYLKGQDLDRHALEVIGDERRGLFGALYQERTAVNRIAKEKRATATEMARTLPAEPEEGDWQTAYEQAQQELADLNRITHAEVEKLKDACAKAKLDIERTLQAKIDELRALADPDKRKQDEQRDDRIAKLQTDYTPKRDDFKARMAEAKTRLEQQVRDDEARKLADRLQGEAESKESEADGLSESLKKLEALKVKLASKSPIPGLEIDGFGLRLNGVAFSEVNDAERMRVAFEIAKLQPGECPLIVVDFLEHLDSENRELFEKAARASGLQVIAAAVSEGNLTIDDDERKNDGGLVEVNF